MSLASFAACGTLDAEGTSYSLHRLDACPTHNCCRTACARY
ncbi:hypothetical protein OG963_14565 [Streptomyces sp. NBC_01707]